MWLRAEDHPIEPALLNFVAAGPASRESAFRFKSGGRFAGLLVGAMAVFVAVVTSARADIKVGDAFPSLAAPGVISLAGGELPVTAGKVVLVDFWASWCAPCKASFPAMAKLHERYADRGLVIAAVSVDEKSAAALSFWKKMSPPFSTLHDSAQKLVQQVVVPAMPTSYLIGRDGRVRLVEQGFHGRVTEEQLTRQIEQLLTEK